MSRKHYIEVAELIKSHSAGLDNEYANNALREVALDMALMFKRVKARVVAGRFFDAAGFPELTGSRMGLN